VSLRSTRAAKEGDLSAYASITVRMLAVSAFRSPTVMNDDGESVLAREMDSSA
jgi:hypothetical protein